jgi:hypothetical protein
MPNTTVPAAGEAMSSAKVNKADVMQTAWENYHRWHSLRESIHGKRAFDRREFAWKLKQAWQHAKQALMSVKDRQILAIRTELDGLKYKPFRINTTPTRIQLEAQLAALAG